MHAHIAMVLLSVWGIDIGWQKLDEGGVEYIIQIEPELLDELRAGKPLGSDLPPALRDVRSWKIVVGRDELPRDAVDVTVAKPVVDDQRDNSETDVTAPGPIVPRQASIPVPGPGDDEPDEASIMARRRTRLRASSEKPPVLLPDEPVGQTELPASDVTGAPPAGAPSAADPNFGANPLPYEPDRPYEGVGARPPAVAGPLVPVPGPNRAPQNRGTGPRQAQATQPPPGNRRMTPPIRATNPATPVPIMAAPTSSPAHDDFIPNTTEHEPTADEAPANSGAAHDTTGQHAPAASTTGTDRASTDRVGTDHAGADHASSTEAPFDADARTAAEHAQAARSALEHSATDTESDHIGLEHGSSDHGGGHPEAPATTASASISRETVRAPHADDAAAQHEPATTPRASSDRGVAGHGAGDHGDASNRATGDRTTTGRTRTGGGEDTRHNDTHGGDTREKGEAAAGAAAVAAEPRPWAWLTATLLGMFVSIGGNLYLVWIVASQRERYRALTRRFGAREIATA